MTMQINTDEQAAISAVKQEISRLACAAMVEIISVEAAYWSDASLGWPEEGKSYAQLLMEGFRIVAKLGDQKFECRVSGGVVRCRPLQS